MLNEQPEIFQITAENAPALWDTLHTPEDRQTPSGWDRIEGEPLPTTLSAAEKHLANRLVNADRRCQYLQEQIDRQAFEAQFERSERQGEIDALSQHFLKEIAEIRAAQTVDNCAIAALQADVIQLDQQLLEERFDEFETTFEPAPSPAVQWLRAAAFLLIGAALMLTAAMTARDVLNYFSPPAQSIPSVSKP